MIAFIAGVIFGIMLGVGCTCLCCAASNAEEDITKMN